MENKHGKGTKHEPAKHVGTTHAKHHEHSKHHGGHGGHHKK